MIYAVNWNPAADITLRLDTALRAGEVYQRVESLWRAGGKGNNVARAVHRWGIPVTAVGFYGGDVGHAIQKRLELSGIPMLIKDIEGSNRLCLTVVDGMGQITEIREMGPRVTPADSQELLLNLSKRLATRDWVTLSGSFAPGLPADTVVSWVTALEPLCQGVLVDMSGASLSLAWQAGATAICPNLEEFQHVEEELSRTRNPTGHILVTEGAEGLRWFSPGPTAVRRVRAPRVVVSNTVGAGDVFLGTLVSRLSEDENWDDAIAAGVAAASASVMTDSVADFDPLEAGRLEGLVRID